MNENALEDAKTYNQWTQSYYLAKNPNTSPKILDELPYEKSFTLQHLVAVNPNTPIHTLERLTEIPSYYWNSFNPYVILNPSSPQYLKLYLYYDIKFHIS